ncbi:hypothetical protein BDR26DRAFT_1004269 [Obelidium mucronatum]|nr:hypothetical protein BDR26DRAFT_1004269 [Obelidium mucronatum]
MSTAASYLQSRVPYEVIVLIFSLLHPRESLKFSRLCQAMYSALANNQHFAHRNLSNFTPAVTSKTGTKSNITRTTLPTELDRLWFLFPPHYQTVYTIYFCKYISEIEWSHRGLFTCSMAPSLPAGLSHLTSLTRLDLSNNPGLQASLSWTPSETEKEKDPDQHHHPLFELPQLVFLNLTNTGLQGTIPKSINRLSNLQHLLLSRNHLAGEIPVEIGSLVELESLNLRGNTLRGQIPKELGQLRKLKCLNLAMNYFSGEVPKSLLGLQNIFL